MTKKKENRKHKRYQVPEGSFVTLGQSNAILGQIVDISMGGLGFRYMAAQIEKPTDESYLDIYLTEGDLCLDRVPIKAISDFETPDTVTYKTDELIPLSSRTMRRCGVQFGALAPGQMSKLELCIQNHTTGELT